VDGDEQHAGIGLEDRLGPVAVVHVPVDDEDPLRPVRVARAARRHGHVVEQAEAHRLVGGGVVAGRAHGGEGVARLAAQDRPRGASARA
jgi:hypothetical protein